MILFILIIKIRLFLHNHTILLFFEIVIIFTKYINFTNIFFKLLAKVLLKHTGINNNILN